MSRTRSIAALLGACAALLAALLLWRHADGRPRLPPAERHPSLPAAFDRDLDRARVSAESGEPDRVRALALLYQANRLFVPARACYAVVAASREGLSAGDHYYLALMALEDSDTDTAQAELRATLAAEPANVPARTALADCLFRSGRPADAQREYDLLLKADPYQPQALLGKARIALQKADDAGALDALRALVRHHPNAMVGTALLAQVLDRRGEKEEAAAMEALAKQTHEPVPADPRSQALLAQSYDLSHLGIAFEQYRLAGQMEEAFALLGRLEELDPQGWSAPTLRGWSLVKAGRYAEAVLQYKKALANGGDPERICPLLVNALLSAKNAPEAAAVLAPYHEKLPRSVPILLSYCEVAVRLRDNALARRLLGEVLALEPDLYMPNMSMVQVLWSEGDHDKAADYLRRVARVFPADVDSRGVLGQYYLEKGDAKPAIAVVREALALCPAEDPRRGRLLSLLATANLAEGSLEASQGNYEEAVACADKAIAAAPTVLRGYALKLNVRRRQGDLAGETQALEQMALVAPKEASLQMALGDALAKSGNRARAAACWQRALELAPADAASLRAELARRLSGTTP